jgi:peptidoglycan-N-acetylmuramic acid deacetylase
MRKRDLYILAGVMAIAFFLGIGIFMTETVETASWGLSFHTHGQPPLGPANAAVLSRYDAAHLRDTAKQVLYLTFDAGYENGCTAQILDILQKHGVTAAFFLVGNYMEKNPDLVRRMAAEGHIVGNHTMHHPDMSKIGDKASFEAELKGLEALFLEKTGKELPKFYRPPQGTYSEENLKMAKELGYKTVFWSLAYVDWNNDSQPTKEQAFDKLIPRIHNGAVVLLHSTSTTNAEILDELLTKWKEMGYTFESIDKLF